MGQWTLYYDGGCNLCHTSKLRVERWAERAGRPFRAEVLQSPEAIAKGYGLTGMVLEADGEVLTASAAWLRLLDLAPWPLRWARIMRRWAWTRALVAWGYGVVARYRYRIFGARACPLPGSPESR